jgi:hypothetical protein
VRLPEHGQAGSISFNGRVVGGQGCDHCFVRDETDRGDNLGSDIRQLSQRVL